MRSKSRRELACPEWGGGCEQREQTEGLHRGCCYLRQPLSLAYGSPAPRKGEPFGLSLYCTKRRPRKRGSCRRKPTEGEHLVPFCISEPFPFRHGFRRDTNAGWNMVVLLRCRLQYSLFRPILPSLHRPLGVLGSNPPQAGTAFGQRLNHKNERVHKKERPHAPFFNFVMLFSPSPRRLQRPLLCASGR